MQTASTPVAVLSLSGLGKERRQRDGDGNFKPRLRKPSVREKKKSGTADEQLVAVVPEEYN